MPVERAHAIGPSASALPILLYHGIRTPADGDGGPFELELSTFTEQMDRLAASGRRTVTIGELLTRRRSSAASADGLAAVTFDDGTADFYHHAWPVLRERGICATLYVTSGLVGRDFRGREMLSWEQLGELRGDGVEIGAHGDHHIALDLVGLDRAAIELVNSKLKLEDRLQRPVASFAYPFGYHTEALKRLLPRVGYTSGCAVKNCLSHHGDDRFALARLTITRRTTPRHFEQLLHGAGAPRAWEGERVRTRLWRAYRRAHARATQPEA
jgi:peptidoglycan/xylan/chitin deacetylase (PgdA/CDA1 family)